MKTVTNRDHWFHNITKMYVIETVDYYTRKGSTTIILHYKPWWKRRRKLKFARTRSTDSELHEQSLEAQAIIARVKGDKN